MTVVRLQDIARVDVAGIHWHPLRRTLGISAFGTNAYSADAGEVLIEPHTEDSDEEMYVLITGRATFTLGGEEFEATPGTVVYCPDPSVHRTAVATEDGTLALAVGGTPGAAGPPSEWEERFIAEGSPSPPRGGA
jgi:quercetin dioxygenase-like cupin family protein